MISTPTTDLYFECHVTIEPVFDEKLALVTELAKGRHFRVADLLMRKRKEDTPERSKFDTFCTGHSKDYDDLSVRMQLLIDDLESAGFKVWRYKIENTLMDSKYSDVLGLLGDDGTPRFDYSDPKNQKAGRNLRDK